MRQFPMCANYAGRRNRGVPAVVTAALLGLAAGLLFGVSLGRAEEAAVSAHPDDPPPVEDLLKSVKPYVSHGIMTVELGPFPNQPARTFSCNVDAAECRAQLARASLHNLLRHCWDTSDKPNVSTELWVNDPVGKGGGYGTAAAEIMLEFGLDPDGMLAASPHIRLFGAARDMHAFANDIERSIERCQPYKLAPGLAYTTRKDITLIVRVVDAAGRKTGNHGPWTFARIRAPISTSGFGSAFAP
jgi:hypothetical protein